MQILKKGRRADPGALGERESLACQIGPKFKLCTRTVGAWLKERGRMKPARRSLSSEQRKPLHCSTVNLLLRQYSAAASMPCSPIPHMLRHACGFALADQGADTRLIQDYLGHRNIQHTVKYTATNSSRFEKLWR